MTARAQVIPKEEIDEQTQILLSNLIDFFSIESNNEKMLRSFRGDPKFSLRILDWFATNYSKHNFVVYNVKVWPDGRPVADYETEDETVTTERFKVYQRYKSMLNSFRKRWFDSFCREYNTSYVDREMGTSYEISVGQLNFFRWVIQYRIMEYIEENHEDILQDIKRQQERGSVKLPQQVTAAGTTKTRKKREELSIYACKCIKKEDVEITVRFD